MSEETNVSSVTTEAPAAPEKTGRRLAEPGKPEKSPLSGGKKAGLIVGIIAAVLVLAYAGCCVAAGVLYAHVAFPACPPSRWRSCGRSRGTPCWTA